MDKLVQGWDIQMFKLLTWVYSWHGCILDMGVLLTWVTTLDMGDYSEYYVIEGILKDHTFHINFNQTTFNNMFI